jgi:uroporphyrinogen III methyltransferase/synthase
MPDPQLSAPGPGTVYLVGAGPGDPGLITVRGLALIRMADVILYDRLVPHELLREARADAELIDVGKESLRKNQKISQEEINVLIINRAQAGHHVVRLKGGDPTVFGRGGEEALACRAVGIPFEVVPGVSSAIAVPAYAGIPVTHRGFVSAFTVFAGHEDPNKLESSVDYDALAGVARMGTLVLLMGVLNLDQIVARLTGAGLPGSTRAACIEWGTTARQRVVEAPLDELPRRVLEAGLRAPATTIIGTVVTLRPALDWFVPPG